MLESAIGSAFATFDKKDLFPTIEKKAARLGAGLILNHAFADGNKRSGTFVMLTFLDANGVKASYTEQDIITLGTKIATGEIKHSNILSWIENHKIKKQTQK